MMAPGALMIALALSSSDGPLVLEVPANGVPLEAQRRPLFYAAPFEVEGGRVRRGPWISSDEILGDGFTRVIVVASWCPACRKLLGRLPAERPGSTVVLLLEDENEVLLERAARQGARSSRVARGAHAEQPLANAAALEGYPLPLHLLRSGSALARQVTHYPFTFVCSRTRCTPERAPGAPSRR